MLYFELCTKIKPNSFWQGILPQNLKINRHLLLRFPSLNGLCPTQVHLRSSSPRCDRIWKQKLQRAKGKHGHKYGTVICQDWGGWFWKKHEEKCIMRMHTHWGKPCGAVPGGHLWTRKMVLFRTDYSDTLWENGYHCLSPQSVVFWNVSLGVPGHHFSGYLSLLCFFSCLFFMQSWDTTLVVGFMGHSWRNQAEY